MELPVLLPSAQEWSCPAFGVRKSAFASGGLYHALAHRSPAIYPLAWDKLCFSGSDRLRVISYACAPCGLCRVLGLLSGQKKCGPLGFCKWHATIDSFLKNSSTTV